MTIVRRSAAMFVLAAATAVSARSGERIVDRAVDSTLWVGKTAVKGTVGAGRIAARGVNRAVGSSTD